MEQENLQFATRDLENRLKDCKSENQVLRTSRDHYVDQFRKLKVENSSLEKVRLILAKEGHFWLESTW